ncbi:WYL domain-containing protein [Eggerthellaceae bacterium zg-997]|nr:WYL domain-containing protein [Eggerthellaceae bacterium zg-997]
MPASSKKAKLLYLSKIFHELTDDEHGLTMPQIIEELASYGIGAERKSVYSDITALQEFGLAIEKLSTSPVSYALVNRPFTKEQILLLADAVQSSRFLTERKSNALVGALETLTSKPQATNLRKLLHVEGRIKMSNESVFYTLDAIQRAIAERRKVRFQYFQYGTDKRQVLQREGQWYEETPVHMTYSDGCYYLVAYNDRHEGFTNYRIDRMTRVRPSDERATRNAQTVEFDVRKYELRAFGMYTGTAQSVTLQVKRSIMGAVIDRFGEDVLTTEVTPDQANIHVTVMESPVFFGWVAQFGDRIRILKPASLVEAYSEYLQRIIDLHAQPAEGA